LEKEYDEKLDELETKLIETLDKFLDSEISEEISDEMLERVAINETLKPIVEGIQNVFSENHIELDSDGAKKIKELSDSLESVKSELSETIAEKMELSELAEKGATKLLLIEKTEGLSKAQKDRINVILEDKSFDETESKIDDIINFVIEDENKSSVDEGEREVVSESEELEVKDEKVPNKNSDVPNAIKALRYL
jgi:hypothetical protein